MAARERAEWKSRERANREFEIEGRAVDEVAAGPDAGKGRSAAT